MKTSKQQLKDLAQKALSQSNGETKWVAIDKDGRVWAYDLKPTVNGLWRCWGNSVDDGYSWHIGTIVPPADFRTELYEINKLLNDDTE